MGEHHCDNCNCDFDVDILNAEYHLYRITYCPSCGSPIDDDEEYD
jgi:hypothetical protein